MAHANFRGRGVAWVVLLITTMPMAAAQQQTDCLGDPLPEGALARLGTTRLRHSDSICHVAYSPDGKQLASLSRDRTLRVWNAVDGKQLHVFFEKSADYYVDFFAVAWSPDGTLLAASGDDPLHGGKAGIRLFDLKTGKEARRINQDQPAYFLAYSSDGKTLVAVGLDRVTIWDTVNGAKIDDWRINTTAAVDVSPDRKTIAWVDGQNEGKVVHICDAATGKELSRLDGHQEHIVSVAYSPDGKYLASGNPVEPILLWDTATGTVVRRFEQKHGGMQMKFTADSKFLACATMDGSIQRWEVETGKEIGKLTGYRGWVSEIAISADGTSLALAGADSQVIHLWDLVTGAERRPAHGHDGQIQTVAFSPDGKLLATGSGDWHDSDQMICLWESGTGKLVRQLLGHHGKICCLAFSPDSKWLVSGCEKEQTFRVWDVVTGEEQAKFQRKKTDVDQVEEFRVGAIAWSPDGNLLVSAHEQALVVLWDFHNRTELRSWKAHEGITNSVAFSPDGQMLISGGLDRTVRVWDVQNGEEMRNFGDLGDTVRCVACSPDGRLIAASTGDYEGMTFLWDMATRRELARLTAPRAHVYQIAFSPDGKLLAGTGPGNSLVLWEIATRMERCRFPGHPAGALAVAFSPDGRIVASGSQDTTVVLWNVAHCADLNPSATPADLDQHWQDLASKDAKLAHRALCAMVAEPEQTLTLMSQRLLPLATMDAQRMTKALTDLDNDRFQVRDKATNDLASLGQLAEPFLRQTLNRDPSLEVRERVQLLLNKLDNATLAPDQLRTLRAFEILERIGGPEARELFEAHARQQPAGPLSRAAQACLDRLSSRQR